MALEKPGLTTPYQLSGQTVLVAETAGNPAVGNADQPVDWVPEPNWAPNTDISTNWCSFWFMISNIIEKCMN